MITTCFSLHLFATLHIPLLFHEIANLSDYWFTQI